MARLRRKEPGPVVPIDWVDDADRWIVVPGTVLEGRRRRIKELPLRRKNCHFARDLPAGIIPFAVRAVSRLALTDRVLLFARGAVRTQRSNIKYNVAIRELEWGVGTLIILPRRVPYRETKTVWIGDSSYNVNVMEFLVLHALIGLAHPGADASRRLAMTALVLTRGWKSLSLHELPELAVESSERGPRTPRA